MKRFRLAVVVVLSALLISTMACCASSSGNDAGNGAGNDAGTDTAGADSAPVTLRRRRRGKLFGGVGHRGHRQTKST